MSYKAGSHLLILILVTVVMVALTGCGGNESTGEQQSPAVEKAHTSEAGAALSNKLSTDDAQDVEQAIATPASFANLPEFDAQAPIVSETWPTLAAGVLTFARAAQLPEDLLVRSNQLQFSRQMFEEQLSDAPADMKEQLSQNEFYVVEQMVTAELVKEAVLTRYDDETGETNLDELTQAYIEELVGDLEVTDEELAAFYAENSNMFRGAEFAVIKDQLRAYMLQQAQQQATLEHLKTLGNSISIEVNRDWVESQNEVAMNDPIVAARASAKPSLVNFGTDNCPSCQKMVATREALIEKYSDQLNVVYVQVNKEQILASKYGVKSIPYLLFFDKEGNEAKSHNGVMSEEEIMKVFADLGVN